LFALSVILSFCLSFCHLPKTLTLLLFVVEIYLDDNLIFSSHLGPACRLLDYFTTQSDLPVLFFFSPGLAWWLWNSLLHWVICLFYFSVWAPLSVLFFCSHGPAYWLWDYFTTLSDLPIQCIIFVYPGPGLLAVWLLYYTEWFAYIISL
jgi:hypothetical protein